MTGSQDEEEEEYLVHVEFDGLLDSNMLDRPNIFFKIIGIDTDKPIMQIEEQVFTGEYRDTVGTALFFEENNLPVNEDPVFGTNSDVQLRYVCKTRKSLVMSRVFLKSKEDGDSGTQTGEKASQKENRQVENQSESVQDTTTKDIQDCSTEDVQECSTKYIQDSTEEDVFNGPPPKLPNISPAVPDALKIKGKQQDFEPIPGPSWAPDITELQFNVMQGSSFEKSVNADDMSRLIAEQMTIASDINMQNVSSDSDETSD